MTTLPFKKRFNAPMDQQEQEQHGQQQQQELQEEPMDLSLTTGQASWRRLRAHQRRHKIKASGRYTCDNCHKTFVQQSSLITHKRIHTGERPYHCKVCDKRYGDLSTFTKHKRTHSGEKPYACRLCKRRFSQSGNCLRHARSVHCRETLRERSLNK